jgi:gas vesicle protein
MEVLIMSENSQVKGNGGSTGTSVTIGIVVGAVIGAGIALLLAPESGKETRQRIAKAGRRWSGAARSKFDEARDAAIDIKHEAKSALEAGFEGFAHDSKANEPQVLRTDVKA